MDFEFLYWIILGLIYLMVKSLRKRRQQPQEHDEFQPTTEEVLEEEETLPAWLESLVKGEDDTLQPEQPVGKKRQATIREDLAAYDEDLAEPVMETEIPLEVISEPQEKPKSLRSKIRSKAPGGGVQKGRVQRALDMREIRDVVARRKKLRQLIVYKEILGPPRALRSLRTGRQF